MQVIHNIAEILAQKGVHHVIVSPGSRCAPLTIAFARHPKLNTKTISDERSAAFIALGLAQALNEPVALLCTSGTAALNYAPAIAEAFYRNIPLIVLTADRPTEWIDQLDGQTIRQQNIYGRHVKESFHIPANHEHADNVWFINRTINEAVNLATGNCKGPVHVNIALREPLYPSNEIVFDSNVRIIKPTQTIATLSENTWDELADEAKNYNTILIVIGQQNPKNELLKLLEEIQENTQIVVVGDIISNITNLKYSIQHHDLFLAKKGDSSFKPDLLITFGLSLISKSLKQFIRNNKPKAHWHIQNAETVADTFQSLTRHISVDAQYFIENFNKIAFGGNAEQLEFWETWQKAEFEAKKHISKMFDKQTFGEFETIKSVLDAVNDNTVIHLANSMSVRYANMIGSNKNISVMANRGTSGIDGSTSTALGHALAIEQTNILITGDMAFFYDRNALWNKYLKPNFKVVILNNHVGGIFRIIEGPKSQPELEEYFETVQSLNAKKAAEDHEMAYYEVNTREDLQTQLQLFLNESNKPAILEIFTDSKTNEEIFKAVKS